jgi:hypothetical protein
VDCSFTASVIRSAWLFQSNCPALWCLRILAIVSGCPFCRTEYALADHPQYKGVINQPPLESKLPTKKMMQTLLAESLPRARHFAVGETYAQHFDSWEPVNLERPTAGEPGVLRRIFALR